MKNIIFVLIYFILFSFSLIAQENIALGKTATQNIATALAANNATDGKMDGKYPNIFLCGIETNAYWEVDLGNVYDIKTIKVYGRTDCCSNRLDNFSISLSTTPFTANKTGNNEGVPFVTNVPYDENERPRVFTGNGYGRYVRIFLNGNSKNLELAEVEVYGNAVEVVQDESADGKSNWMGANYNALRLKPIKEFCFPGTHDSGAYELFDEMEPDANDILKTLWDAKAGESSGLGDYIEDLALTQTQSFREQLNNGIRYLDLRICQMHGEYYTMHSLRGNKISILLDDIKAFLMENEKEIVLIKLNTSDFKTVIENKFGTNYYKGINNKDDVKTFLNTSYEELVNSNQRAVFIYGAEDNIDKNYDESKTTNNTVLAAAKELSSSFAKDNEFQEIQFNRPVDMTSSNGIKNLILGYIQEYGCRAIPILPALSAIPLVGSALSSLGLTAGPAVLIYLQNFDPIPTSLKDHARDSRSIIKDYFTWLALEDNKEVARPNMIICDFFEEVPLVDMAIKLTLGDNNNSSLLSGISNESMQPSSGERFTSVLGCGTDMVAAIFFLAGYGANEAAQFIDENIPGVTGDVMAGAFRGAGYGAEATGKALMEVKGLSADLANDALEAVGFPEEDTKKFFNDAGNTINDGAIQTYLGGKEFINWTVDAANTTSKVMEGALSSTGNWVKGAESTVSSWFGGGGRSHSYNCPDESFTSPYNGINSGSVPEGVHQYRITLTNIKNVDRGDEGNDHHEIWGSVIVKTNMYMQKNANPWLFNKSCREAVSCKYNVATVVNNNIDFFIPSNLSTTARFNIELDLFEEDPGYDDPFKKEVLTIEYRNGMGFPLLPGKTRLHKILLEETDYDGALQKIEVTIKIKRVLRESELETDELLIVRNNNQLNTRTGLISFFTPVPNSGSVKAVTQLHDGTILGVGMDNQLYTRTTLNSNWVKIQNSGSVKAVTQLHDRNILGVGMDNQLYTRTTLNSNWVKIQNSGSVKAVIQLYDGTILGVGMNNQLYTRATLSSNWIQIQNSGSVISITQLYDGTIVGVGVDNQLYTRATLNSNWVKIPYSGSVKAVTTFDK